MRFLSALTLMMFVFTGGFANAVNPDEVLDNPALEQRARALSADLRCLVCQNQSIDDSDADFARDMRVIVRERLVAGDSDEQVIEFMVARYGEFVLLKPRFAAHTIFLWVSPFVVFLAGLLLIIYWKRSQSRVNLATQTLNDEEEAALKALVDKEKQS